MVWENQSCNVFLSIHQCWTLTNCYNKVKKMSLTRKLYGNSLFCEEYIIPVQDGTMGIMVGERTMNIRKSGVKNKHRSLFPCLPHCSLLFPAVRRSLLVSLWDKKFFYTEIALICVWWCDSHVAYGNSACLPCLGHSGWWCRDTKWWLVRCRGEMDHIATLGPILEFQPYWKSGKSQLAR